MLREIILVPLGGAAPADETDLLGVGLKAEVGDPEAWDHVDAPHQHRRRRPDTDLHLSQLRASPENKSEG